MSEIELCTGVCYFRLLNPFLWYMLIAKETTNTNKPNIEIY